MATFRQFLIETFVPQKGTQMGSNEGGIHTKDGKKYYVKYYKQGDQAKVEALTGKLYHHMGIQTVKPEYHNMNGKHAVVTEYNDDLKAMPSHHYKSLSHEHAVQVGRMYHAAILTKNWDIVGLEHDNIMRHKDGDLHAIDHGGAFHFRARGGPKDYGPDIAEHHSLRHNDQASGQVFKTVFSKHPKAEHEGLDAVKHINDKHVHGLFKESGLHNWKDLHKNFVARKSALLKHYEKDK
jgi:hypothetical protein